MSQNVWATHTDVLWLHPPITCDHHHKAEILLKNVLLNAINLLLFMKSMYSFMYKCFIEMMFDYLFFFFSMLKKQ